jgi:hypothetical protein
MATGDTTTCSTPSSGEGRGPAMRPRRFRFPSRPKQYLRPCIVQYRLTRAAAVTSMCIARYKRRFPMKTQPISSPTVTSYGVLDEAYGYFNYFLFGDTLPACLITLQRKGRSFGYFAGERFASPDNTLITDEIAITRSILKPAPSNRCFRRWHMKWFTCGNTTTAKPDERDTITSNGRRKCVP